MVIATWNPLWNSGTLPESIISFVFLYSGFVMFSGSSLKLVLVDSSSIMVVLTFTLEESTCIIP